MDDVKDELRHVQLMNYLLGELSEAEEEFIEVRYFSDPEYLDELLVMRAELFDALALGVLPVAEQVKLACQMQRLPAFRWLALFAQRLRELLNQRCLDPHGGLTAEFAMPVLVCDMPVEGAQIDLV